MEPDSDRLKDLLLEPPRSRWPMISGILLLAAALAGAGYWLHSSSDPRADLQNLAARVSAFAQGVVNKPILSSPAAPAAQEAAPSQSVPDSTQTDKSWP